MTTKSVDGVDRAMSRYRQIAAAINIERHAAEHNHTEPVVANPRALPGDTRRLRGIPAIGRGVAGEIIGTRPG